jgi:hypothetical protein
VVSALVTDFAARLCYEKRPIFLSAYQAGPKKFWIELGMGNAVASGKRYILRRLSVINAGSKLKTEWPV